jgi:hypothetical protein
MMTWLLIAFAVASGVDWRRLGLLALALVAPAPFLALVAFAWWRARPDTSLRAVRFAQAVSAELRAGASLRQAVERSALSVEANEVGRLCREGSAMSVVAGAASRDFPEVGAELSALLARAGDIGISPASLFDEIGDLALAQVEVAHEVSMASASARATGAVLLGAAVLGVGWTLAHSGLEPFLRQPAQRAAALTGAVLVLGGLAVSLVILRRAR